VTDPFEDHLQGLFATQPDMADSEAFAARIEHELNREMRRWVFVAIAGLIVAAGVSLPLVGKLLAAASEKTAVVLEWSPTGALNSSLMIVAAMMLVGVTALMFGRYQAAQP
jgi:hypothetical protein